MNCLESEFVDKLTRNYCALRDERQKLVGNTRRFVSDGTLNLFDAKIEEICSKMRRLEKALFECAFEGDCPVYCVNHDSFLRRRYYFDREEAQNKFDEMRQHNPWLATIHSIDLRRFTKETDVDYRDSLIRACWDFLMHRAEKRKPDAQ